MKRYPDNCGPIEYINGEAYKIIARYTITEVKDPTLIKDWLIKYGLNVIRAKKE